MKAIFTSKKPDKLDKFPKLMTDADHDCVLLATGKSSEDHIEGVIIWANKNSPNDIGEFDKGWVANCFTDLTGSVSLSND